jgi:hypothetical protein
MFSLGLLGDILYFTDKLLIGHRQHSFSVSPGNFLTLKISWNYYQEFSQANGGRLY